MASAVPNNNVRYADGGSCVEQSIRRCATAVMGLEELRLPETDRIAVQEQTQPPTMPFRICPLPNSHSITIWWNSFPHAIPCVSFSCAEHTGRMCRPRTLNIVCREIPTHISGFPLCSRQLFFVTLHCHTKNNEKGYNYEEALYTDYHRHDGISIHLVRNRRRDCLHPRRNLEGKHVHHLRLGRTLLQLHLL